MAITDPIANMLTMIRNATRDKKETIEIPASKAGIAIAKILQKEGYLENYRAIEDSKQGILKVYLKYVSGGKPSIIGIKKISKPGLRVYVSKDKIPFVLNGLGIAILSTDKGIMTDRQAREMHLGGEVLCHIW